jgi:membrane-associated phospholipid phosphatase
MKKIISFIIFYRLFIPVFSQDPYKLKGLIDGPIIIGGMASSYVGLEYYLKEKPHLDSAFVAGLKPTDINRFDRGATKYFDGKANRTYADAALFSSFAIPLFLTADKAIRSDALKVGILYAETMTIMANVYVWGVGTSTRIRPYVYNPEVPLSSKLGSRTRDSFFAGHPAAAAASTFFFAKVFSDYHPDSKLRYVFWSAAVIPPSIVAYFRYKEGQHFPTDILAGIPIGAAIGILVPHCHKIKNKNVSLFPTPGGVGMKYKL